MISKEMFDFLKQVQREPRKTAFSEIYWEPLDKNVLKGIIREALELGYIYAVNPNQDLEEQWWRLTEKGAAEVTDILIRVGYYKVPRREKKSILEILNQANKALEFLNSIRKG